MNEYLTGISLSAEALCELIEYFEQGDRPVVLCMVGDHTTSFANDIVSAEYSEQEADLRLRGTPYVVWSNCDIDESWLPEYVSLHSLGSCVLASAGAARSDYDSYVAQLTRQVPVFLSGGDWYDAEGQRHDYQGMAQLPEALQDYVCLLYNNLAGGEGRLGEFFCGG